MRSALLSTIAVAATTSAMTINHNMRTRAYNTSGSSAAKLLISNPGNIFLYDYDSSSNSVKSVLDHQVSGVPSWTSFVGPNTIYAVDENSATTRIFNVDISSNSITDGPTAEGSSGVVHFSFNPEHTRMVGAGYGSGKVDIWNIENGGLQLIKTLTSDDPLGPNSGRQDAAHPHESVNDPSGRFFAVNDLGTDHILLIDGKDDKWEIVNHIPVTPGGVGPRHGAFYPTDAAQATHYFLACEMGSVIVVFELEYTDDSITFNQIQSVSTYGPGRGPANAGSAAAGELVINGDDVYVSNRLTGNATDNVAHFKVMKNDVGHVTDLTYREDVSSGGILPRMFSIGDAKDKLFVGNQAGDSGLVVLPIGQDGTLSEATASVTQSAFGTTPSGGPECVSQIA